ncbi:hypothetical protein DBR40_07365 [Pedobacter sp. KBW01]|uniref:hypothetical protein n=1 Tax=Pedobacter sp. KBW01 TaxID=2153364 RepID=UPI000F5A11C4|nr:hypothetical protein [Pedobacter sp. KBW01]RQO77786.1 hypothetical protein DBR40_07365 [Pedobacter sp. KBW01]
MANLNKENIKHNIFKLLHFSGLTDLNFADLLDISPRQLKYIKNGNAEFSIDSINKACDFFKRSLLAINSNDIELDITFRSKLINIHKNNPEYFKFLSETPSITYAINFELLYNEEFIKDGLEIKDIRRIFKAKGWDFTSSYTSLGINRNQDKILIKAHPAKLRTNIYKKR